MPWLRKNGDSGISKTLPKLRLRFCRLIFLFKIMVNEIEVQKLKSEYPEFFEQVSPKLLELILSEETAFNIAEICLENGIEDEEKIEKIASRVALTLLNEVPKENLAEIFEKGVKINPETAQKISIEVKRLIFSQIEETQLEKVQLTQPTKPSSSGAGEENPERSSKKDVYREPIE